MIDRARGRRAANRADTLETFIGDGKQFIALLFAANGSSSQSTTGIMNTCLP
jgi:hypothetical protein